MTIKEQVIDLMRIAGYDFITACEEFERVKSEVLKRGKPMRFYARGGGSFTLAPKRKGGI